MRAKIVALLATSLIATPSPLRADLIQFTFYGHMALVTSGPWATPDTPFIAYYRYDFGKGTITTAVDGRHTLTGGLVEAAIQAGVGGTGISPCYPDPTLTNCIGHDSWLSWRDGGPIGFISISASAGLYPGPTIRMGSDPGNRSSYQVGNCPSAQWTSCGFGSVEFVVVGPPSPVPWASVGTGIPGALGLVSLIWIYRRRGGNVRGGY